jgi:serine/threonine protein kinase
MDQVPAGTVLLTSVPPTAVVISNLGSGTYGTVRSYSIDLYTALMLGIKDEQIAVKKVKMTNGEGVPGSSVREIHCLQKLRSCDGIVHLLGVDMSVDMKGITTVNIIIPVYDGDMKSYIKSVPTIERLRYYNICLGQLVMALEHLKYHGIIHRDIKPDNILMEYEYSTVTNTLVEAPKCYLSDFGLSTQLECDPTMRGYMDLNTNIYSADYRPPEVALNLSYDHRADIWALGMTMVQHLCGDKLVKVPTDDNRQVLQQIFTRTNTPRLFDKDVIPNYKAGLIMDHMDVKGLLSHSLSKLHMKEIPQKSIDTLNGMLTLYPEARTDISSLIVSHTPCANAAKITERGPYTFKDEKEASIYYEVMVSLFDMTYNMEEAISMKTLVYAYDLMSRYLYVKGLPSNDHYYHLGWACYLISAKMLEVSLDMSDIVHYSNNKTTSAAVKIMEMDIIRTMNYILMSCEMDIYINHLDSLTDDEERINLIDRCVTHIISSKTSWGDHKYKELITLSSI